MDLRLPDFTIQFDGALMVFDSFSLSVDRNMEIAREKPSDSRPLVAFAADVVYENAE
jgi:hypothetical protein